MKETVLLIGGRGLIGKELTSFLEKQYHLFIFSTQKSACDDQKTFYWNIDKKILNTSILKRSNHIIYLAGEHIIKKRWSSYQKEEIFNSRIKGIKLCVQQLKIINDNDDSKKRNFITVAALPSNTSNQFIQSLITDWEKTILDIRSKYLNVFLIKVGFVLSNQGGLLAEIFQKSFWNLFFFWKKKHPFYWIHIYDLCQIIIQLIQKRIQSSIFYAITPEKATNLCFAKALQAALSKKYYFFFLPSIFFKIFLGQRAMILLHPFTKIHLRKKQHFKFCYPALKIALKNLLSNDGMVRKKLNRTIEE